MKGRSGLGGIRTAAKWNRKLHRWGALVAALPLVVVIGSGILLQLKKEADWIQPPTLQGSGTQPTVGFERILEAVKSVPEANVTGWDEIQRLDVQPRRGIVKVQCANGREVQIDTATGDVLQVAVRRSGLIESIHDGSFFHPRAKLGVFLPAGLVLAGLWGTGVYLFALPYLVRRYRK